MSGTPGRGSGSAGTPGRGRGGRDSDRGGGRGGRGRGTPQKEPPTSTTPQKEPSKRPGNFRQNFFFIKFKLL